MMLLVLVTCAPIAAAAGPQRACPSADRVDKLAARAWKHAGNLRAWCRPVRVRDVDRWLVVGVTERFAHNVTHVTSYITLVAHDGTVIASQHDPDQGHTIDSFQHVADLDGDGIDEVVYMRMAGDSYDVVVIGLAPTIARGSEPLPDPTCERLEIATTARERHVVIGCERRVRYRWSRRKLVKL